jgi:hypothetical protein
MVAISESDALATAIQILKLEYPEEPYKEVARVLTNLWEELYGVNGERAR